jgi:hypothetical protein
MAVGAYQPPHITDEDASALPCCRRILASCMSPPVHGMVGSEPEDHVN